MTSKRNEKKKEGILETTGRIFTPTYSRLAECATTSLFRSFQNSVGFEHTGRYTLKSNDEGPLGYEIDMEELKSFSNILKPGKAPGSDNIDNVMISSLVETHLQIFLKLFNAILILSEVILEWIMGLIVPIFKKGSKSEPSNYRRITLISCMGKLFLAILTN